MPDFKKEKIELLKSLGLPLEKLPENKLNSFIDSIDDSIIEDKNLDFDQFIEKFDLSKHVQNILSTDNGDIVNLLKQLEKLRNKNKGQ
ncbi:hypothetical protein FBALC1_11497 [Flavobacteriales bacterium ALC-1]|nr:hypothetical protein FBALC1_11497 [Flavobacteriales bacterium ALC-1]